MTYSVHEHITLKRVSAIAASPDSSWLAAVLMPTSTCSRTGTSLASAGAEAEERRGVVRGGAGFSGPAHDVSGAIASFGALTSTMLRCYGHSQTLLGSSEWRRLSLPDVKVPCSPYALRYYGHRTTPADL